MKKRKALVTGGLGFIGSHLVRHLVDYGWEVTIVDDLSGGDLSSLFEKEVRYRTVMPCMIDNFLFNAILANGETLVVTGDFADEFVLQHLLRGDYTHVFHLAANPRVEASVKEPANTSEINLQKTIELMSICRQIENIKFIFASSSAVYGDAKEMPTPIHAKKLPKSPYGLQKFCVEKFMRMFGDLYGLQSIALRFANVYGPGADGSSPYATAIAAWCEKLSEGKPLRSDGDGEQSRDLVYVSDVAEALRLAAEAQLPDKFAVYNVGTGGSVSNIMLLSFLETLVGNFEIFHAPERPGDAKHTQLCIVNTRKDLGWEPTVKIQDGIKRTLEWWEIKCK